MQNNFIRLRLNPPKVKYITGTRIFIYSINTFLTNQMYKGGDYGRSII
jgi:hypothetical protein